MSTVEAEIETKHPVDRVPPLARLAPLGLQHVLAMYAGAVAVPRRTPPMTTTRASEMDNLRSVVRFRPDQSGLTGRTGPTVRTGPLGRVAKG